jgi:hypothetical protein
LTDETLGALDSADLLEDDSYAMRPFFMTQIADLAKNKSQFETFIEFPLRGLVEGIVDREAKLLENVRPKDQSSLRDLMSLFFREVARDMADAEAEAIDESALSIIADLVFGGHLHDEDLAMLRHRLRALALLEQDSAQERRRFPHSQIQDYFLGCAYLELIGAGELPKSIRRNIIGVSFLEVFYDIAATAEQHAVERFLLGASGLLSNHGFEDRGRRNVAALVLAAISGSASLNETIRLSDLVLDEALIRGYAPPCELLSVNILQLDARGADLSALVLKDSQIGALIADSTTILPPLFPVPGILSLSEGRRAKPEFEPRRILDWLSAHTRPDIDAVHGPGLMNEYTKLFEKLCRIILRQTRIRDIQDDRAGRLLEDNHWPAIRQVLERHAYLEIRESFPAGGRKSTFYRIRRANEFLDPQCKDEGILRTRKEIGALN